MQIKHGDETAILFTIDTNKLFEALYCRSIDRKIKFRHEL